MVNFPGRGQYFLPCSALPSTPPALLERGVFPGTGLLQPQQAACSGAPSGSALQVLTPPRPAVCLQ